VRKLANGVHPVQIRGCRDDPARGGVSGGRADNTFSYPSKRGSKVEIGHYNQKQKLVGRWCGRDDTRIMPGIDRE
jgi:hypothetical protein